MILRLFCLALPLVAADLRVATFQADVTPRVGEPVAYVAARSIEDPLSARGVVLLGAGKPIVLCAVDYIGIANDGNDVWRERLATAAGTTADRVAVHTLHQHDAPRYDRTAALLLKNAGLDGRVFSEEMTMRGLEATVAAVRASLGKAQRVTAVGHGKAKVERVASNRRILGEDGNVKIGRMSASRNPEAIAAPEGTIDPYLQVLSFWNGEKPVAVLTYYATHPQSYYGKGDVTAEYVGLARAQRERELPGVPHVHFNGAAGNVAAGKYNDGSPANRPVLTGRLAAGMKAAWENTKKMPVPREVEWRVEPVVLPARVPASRADLEKTLADGGAKFESRRSAATQLSWLKRVEERRAIGLACLRLGNLYVLHMPGELFVEYQLAAQKMRPESMVLMAAYGDYGTGYIGTAVAYGQGGYEVGPNASLVTPEVEEVLMGGMRRLLR